MKSEEFYFCDKSPELSTVQLDINHKLNLLEKRKASGEIDDYVAFAHWHYCNWECGHRLHFMQYVFTDGENKLQAANEWLEGYIKLQEQYAAKIESNGWEYRSEDDHHAEIECAAILIKILEHRK